MERLRIKLLIDGGAKRVAFAEAGKEVVDFLFRLLSLPVVAVAAVVGKDAKEGSLGNLHGSIANLNDHLLPDAKEALLKSAAAAAAAAEKPKKSFYRCSNSVTFFCYARNIADDPRAVCPICGSQMATSVPYVAAAGGDDDDGGVVKGLATYMVMDDLTISPMSIDVLKKLNVNNFADLEEKIVVLGKDEGVKLLRASLHSKKVLTDVFLKDLNNIPSNPCTSSSVKREFAGAKRERRS